jgi:predicted  nucleic acid-binding Zn-ribbon protein
VQNKDFQKQLDIALKEKLNLEYAFTAILGNLERLHMELKTERERWHSDVDELRKQLEDALAEKTNLKRSLTAEVEKSRGM